MKNYSSVVHAITRAYIRDAVPVLGEDIAKTLSGWVRSRSIQNLATCTTAFPRALSSREQRRALMQIEAFYKKAKIFSNPDVCGTAALDAFERGEKICRITNKRLDHYGVERERLAPDLNQMVVRMERWISSTLGPYSDFLTALPEEIRVTAGATATLPRRRASRVERLSKKPSCSASAVPYLEALASWWGYGRIRPKLVEWNRVETVPKNWKTDRTIACEAEGNVLLQLAFDSYVKRRLRKRGIDLRDQSRNQRLAMEGSIDGNFATIDLEMASDTMAYNTVALLLPHEWFRYLSHVRSDQYVVRRTGAQGEYAKFSSMGNGATFTLETLIFAAACHAVGSTDFSVYGDDIIIETELAADLERVMRFLGFMINREKSYTNGPFRESCGVNCFAGTDITPFYIRELDGRKPFECHLVNGLCSIALPGGSLERLLIDLVRDWELPLIPFCEDSTAGVFIDIHSAYTKKLLRHRRDGLTFVKHYVCKIKTVKIYDSRGLFLWHLDRRNGDRRTYEESPLNIGKAKVGSWAPIGVHRYVRKWVHWIPPVAGTPLHLYRWSELITSK